MSEATSSNKKYDTVQINDIDMFYARQGVWYPLILLHGGAGSHRHWDQHVPLISQNFKTIVPDLRGHGRSTNPLRKLEYHQMADDIVKLMDEDGRIISR